VEKEKRPGLTQDVVSRAAQGDRSAQEEVLNESCDLVRGMLYRMVGPSPDFEDLQQTVLVRVLCGLKQWRQEATFSSWVGSICVNAIRDHFRGQKVRARSAAGADSASELERAADPLDTRRQIEAREALAGCWRVLDTLSTDHRMAFVLRVMGHSVEEIAEIMKAARSTTRMRLYWARKAFMRAMAQEGDGVPPWTTESGAVEG
jgi:RNA polymerase sigma-70 factor (ECF subfamily)